MCYSLAFFVELHEIADVLIDTHTIPVDTVDIDGTCYEYTGKIGAGDFGFVKWGRLCTPARHRCS